MASLKRIASSEMAKKVLVLVEEHYDETEYNVFNSISRKKD